MKQSIYIAFGIAVSLLLGICVYAFFLPYPADADTRGGIADFSQGWSDETSDQILNIDGSDYPPGADEVVVNKKLPDTLPRDAVLYMSSKHNTVACFAGDRELVCEGVCTNRAFGLDYVGIWVIMPLDEADAGQTVSLHIKKTEENKGQLPSELLLANRNALTRELVHQTSARVLIAFMTLTLSLGLFVASRIMKKRVVGNSDKTVIWLAVFILFAGVWMLMDDNIACLFAPNNDAFYFLSYHSFMLLPVPFAFFIGECIPKSKKTMHWLSAGYIAVFLISMFSAVFYRKPLSLMLPVTHVLIIVGLAATVFYAIRDKDETGRIRMRELFWGICFFVITILGALVLFYLGATRYYALLFKAAILLFVTMLSWGVMRRAIVEIERARGFETLTQTIPCGICRLNCRNGFSIAYANDSYYAMFGYDPAEARALGFDEFDYILLQEDRERLRQELADRISLQEQDFEIEVRARHKSGALMYILTTNNYLPERGEIVSSLTDITVRRNMEDQLRISEMEFRIAAEQSEKYIMRYEIKSKCLYAHKKAVLKFGILAVSQDAVNSLINYRFIGQASIDKHVEFFNKIHRGDASGWVVLQMYAQDISMFRWYHVDFTTVFDHYGEPDQAIISFYDITEQRENELAYERLRLDAQAVPQDQVITFECNLTQDEIDKITGNLISDLATGTGFDARTKAYILLTHPADRTPLLRLMNREHLTGSFASGTFSHNLEFRMLFGGSYHWLQLSIQVVKYTDNEDLKAFVVIRDIHTQKTSEIELIQRSETDGLTGIMNRVAFVDSIDALIKHAGVKQHTLVMMDVDHFKEVNDTLGHDMGDKVLRDVAANLRKTLREGDLLGRMGGDEFAFCFVNLADDRILRSLLERVRSLLNHDIGGGLCQSISMGAATFGDDVADFTEVYKKADIALYQAKRNGRNQFAIYNVTME